MSDKKPSNPSAFPSPHHSYVNGMTLRDYFAGLLMAARYANPNQRGDMTDGEMARAAYQRADALLAVREEE